jgi:hypothetical protein
VGATARGWLDIAIADAAGDDAAVLATFSRIHDDRTRAATSYYAATALLRAGRSGDALELYERLVHDPDAVTEVSTAEAWRAIGDMRRALGDNTAARIAYRAYLARRTATIPTDAVRRARAWVDSHPGP